MKSAYKIRYSDYFLLGANPVIRFLILSDIILQGSAGLLAPIFALFVQDFISTTDTAAVAGISAAIFLIVKSVAQIPAATIIDAIPGERDDFRVLFWASLVMGIVPISYIFVHSPAQLYVSQAILGLVTAFSFPSWMAIFTRHIDKKSEGTEWGIYFTLTNLSMAAAAAIGGALVSMIGFHEVIIVLVVLNIFGSLLILPIAKRMRKPRN